MIEYGYKEFGIMFISPELNKQKTKKIQNKVKKFDKKINKYTEKQCDLFYKELEKEGYYNNMGVIQKH